MIKDKDRFSRKSVDLRIDLFDSGLWESLGHLNYWDEVEPVCTLVYVEVWWIGQCCGGLRLSLDIIWIRTWLDAAELEFDKMSSLHLLGVWSIPSSYLRLWWFLMLIRSELCSNFKLEFTLSVVSIFQNSKYKSCISFSWRFTTSWLFSIELVWESYGQITELYQNCPKSLQLASVCT